MAERDVATSARRRRERQLRSFLGHEELSVKMALARALHHSAQRVEEPRERVEGEMYGVPRRQKLPLPGTRRLRTQKRPLLGTRRARLAEVSGPQEAAVTVGYVAAAVPVGSPPLLQGGDGIDGRAIRYLLNVNLARQKKRGGEGEEEGGEGEGEKGGGGGGGGVVRGVAGAAGQGYAVGAAALG